MRKVKALGQGRMKKRSPITEQQKKKVEALGQGEKWKKRKNIFTQHWTAEKEKALDSQGGKWKSNYGQCSWSLHISSFQVLLSKTFFEIESLLPENLSYNIGEHYFWPKNFSYANSHEVCPTWRDYFFLWKWSACVSLIL